MQIVGSAGRLQGGGLITSKKNVEKSAHPRDSYRGPLKGKIKGKFKRAGGKKRFGQTEAISGDRWEHLVGGELRSVMLEIAAIRSPTQENRMPGGVPRVKVCRGWECRNGGWRGVAWGRGGRSH